MYLEELFDYKDQLMEDLLTEPKIVSLIDSDTPLSDAKKLVYSKVFPFEFVPETIQHGDTLVCVDVDIQESINKTFLLPTIYVWLFTHKSNLRLPEGGVRTDRLCSEIAKKINGSRFYGLGELNLYSVRRFAPLTDFQGKVMTFHAKEFNRVYNHNKQTPSNRKKGV